jgi:putative transcriptional regulator
MKMSQEEFNKAKPGRKKREVRESELSKDSDNKLGFFRVQKKWTQEQLGNRIRLKREYISRLETGKINPTIITALKLSRAVNATIEEIWGDCLA